MVMFFARNCRAALLAILVAASGQALAQEVSPEFQAEADAIQEKLDSLGEGIGDIGGKIAALRQEQQEMRLENLSNLLPVRYMDADWVGKIKHVVVATTTAKISWGIFEGMAFCVFEVQGPQTGIAYDGCNPETYEISGTDGTVAPERLDRIAADGTLLREAFIQVVQTAEVGRDEYLRLTPIVIDEQTQFAKLFSSDLGSADASLAGRRGLTIAENGQVSFSAPVADRSGCGLLTFFPAESPTQKAGTPRTQAMRDTDWLLLDTLLHSKVGDVNTVVGHFDNCRAGSPLMLTAFGPDGEFVLSKADAATQEEKELILALELHMIKRFGQIRAFVDYADMLYR